MLKLPRKKKPAKTKQQIKSENEFSTHQKFLKKEQVLGFKKLLDENASESEIDNYLQKNIEIFTSVLHNYRTGHHGTIVLSQQSIRPKIKSKNQRGLIPDFLIGGDSSYGWEWYVLELKSSTQNIFTEKKDKVYFNSVINKGICQLLEYIDYCTENQTHLRDTFGLKNFREPNGILISGRESEFNNEHKKRLKGSWNRVNKGKLEIRSYDWILRNLDPFLELNEKSV
jgi:hypothetical protein